MSDNELKPYSFITWWKSRGRLLAHNTEVTKRHIAEEAWRAGQQNKVITPHRAHVEAQAKNNAEKE